MTVRTWITLSVGLLVAMTAAVFIRFLLPVEAPPILVRSGDVRLDGSLVAACWPQRGGELRCEDGDTDAGETATVPREGTFRIIVAYPAQPEEGYLRISPADGKSGEREHWDDELDYELEPGRYVLEARAEYPQGGHVAYRFNFRSR